MKSTLQGELVPEIKRILKPQRIGRAYPELRCTFGGRSTVPDITYYCFQMGENSP